MNNDINAMIESFVEQNPRMDETCRYSLKNTFCPYFLPEERALFREYYSDIHDNENDALYEAVYAGSWEKTKSWMERVSELDEELKHATEPEEIDRIKQAMVDLGWNPEIEYNMRTQEMARIRIESIINDRINKITVIEATDDCGADYDIIEESSKKETIYPVHVILVKGDSAISKVITKITPGEFSHAGLALDNDLERIYSFNFDNKIKFGGGFSLESIKDYPKNNRLAVYTVFVTKQAYDTIEKNINNLLNGIKHTSYSIINLISFPFRNVNINMSDSMICSQFVDSILKIANLDFTNTVSSKVSPNKLYFSMNNNPKVFKTFDGIAKDYDVKKINRFINKIRKTATPANESGMLESVVLEARKIPIEVSSEGDVLLTNPFPDYNAEYFASHKLLLNYEKSGNIDGMKYELARLYYMNYVLERKLYHNKNLPRKQEHIKTRARILNDFNKYLKYVSNKDKKFNFSEYYESSPFYPHTIEVKSSTIGQVKDIIKYIL